MIIELVGGRLCGTVIDTDDPADFWYDHPILSAPPVPSHPSHLSIHQGGFLWTYQLARAEPGHCWYHLDSCRPDRPGTGTTCNRRLYGP